MTIINQAPVTPNYGSAAPPSPMASRSALAEAMMGMPTSQGAPPVYSAMSSALSSPILLGQLLNRQNPTGPASNATPGQISQGMQSAGATPEQAQQVADASMGDDGSGDPYASGLVGPGGALAQPMGFGAPFLNMLGLGGSPGGS